MEIQDSLGCSERTAYRWLTTLENLHFTIGKQKTGEGTVRYCLPKDSVQEVEKVTIPRLGLGLKEIFLLNLVLSKDGLFTGTELQSVIDSIASRLLLALPHEQQDLAQRLSSLVVRNSKPRKSYKNKEDIIEVLTQAMLARRQCLVLYHSFSKGGKYRFGIHPLHFFESQGGLYVMVQLAYMRRKITDVKETIRTLAVERIEEINKLPKTFEYPKGLDPEAMLSEAFDIIWNDPIEVKIRFTAQEAPYVMERAWPGEYSWTLKDDGSLIFCLKTSGYEDVKRWILSFGPGAEVLEPEYLREDIAETCREIGQKYRRRAPIMGKRKRRIAEPKDETAW